MHQLPDRLMAGFPGCVPTAGSLGFLPWTGHSLCRLLVSSDAKCPLWALPSPRSREATRSGGISWRSCLHLWVWGLGLRENVVTGRKVLTAKLKVPNGRHSPTLHVPKSWAPNFLSSVLTQTPITELTGSRRGQCFSGWGPWLGQKGREEWSQLHEPVKWQ